MEKLLGERNDVRPVVTASAAGVPQAIGRTDPSSAPNPNSVSFQLVMLLITSQYFISLSHYILVLDKR
jgi:hypothetical protein